MELHLLTWLEVEEYLKNSKAIIIPIGSTEQHGPMGLIGTDCICPESIAKRIGEENNTLIGPTINIGMAQHHLGFPGSIALQPTTLIAVVKDYVKSLARNGFKYFYFLNGHGGNVNTVQSAFSEIYSEHSYQSSIAKTDIHCRLANWYLMPNVLKLVKKKYGDKEGQHATPSEISVTQFVFPGHIKKTDLKNYDVLAGSFTDAEDYRRRYPDGRMESDSSLAKPEHGMEFVDVCVEDVKNDFLKFLSAFEE